MRICAIGDPHGNIDVIRTIPLNNVDAIILTGDIGAANFARQRFFENIERKKQGFPEKETTRADKRKSFMETYTSMMRIVKYVSTFAPVYTIFGNVEYTNAATRTLAEELNTTLPYMYDELSGLPNVRVINNRIANIGGIRVGGLRYFTDVNWVRTFKPSDYGKQMQSAKRQTDKAKRVLRWFDCVDILVSHQPPFSYLDEVTNKAAPKHWQNQHAGSATILAYVKKKQPKFVLCGHIHEGEGRASIGRTTVYNLGVAGHIFLDF